MIKFDKAWDRREFLEFMGRGAIVAGAGPLLWSACATGTRARGKLPFAPIRPNATDQLLLAPGLEFKVLAKWGDPINAGQSFGSHCDFTALFPLMESKGEALLWVNHEYVQPLFATGSADVIRKKRRKSDVLKEMEQVGGSIIKVKKNISNGRWDMVKDDPLNRRITARSSIPFVWDEPIAGSRAAVGMVWNCAGGVTPWRTVLSCEEEYANFWGERAYSGGRPAGKDFSKTLFGWESVFDYPPEHYGWVVEIDPMTGRARKLVAMGRFSHECATVRVAEDGRCVVYSGEDSNGGCLYKFVADKPGSLERGTLFAADTVKGQWLPLVWKDSLVLKGAFRDQTEVLVRAHEAAILVGATPLDRPEDIEVDPATGALLVSLTNNYLTKNFVGSIMRVVEKDPLAMELEAKTFLAGGAENGFACPDNLAFDPRGNLWMTSDISGSAANKGEYVPFGNNGLFYIPMSGDNAGEVFQVGSAPMDAEFTGPTFTADGRTLFLSIQHPGETSKSMNKLTSHWPDGGSSIPRSSVITIQGPALDALMGIGDPKAL